MVYGESFGTLGKIVCFRNNHLTRTTGAAALQWGELRNRLAVVERPTTRKFQNQFFLYDVGYDTAQQRILEVLGKRSDVLLVVGELPGNRTVLFLKKKESNTAGSWMFPGCSQDVPRMFPGGFAKVSRFSCF